jgi:hypothetical protein
MGFEPAVTVFGEDILCPPPVAGQRSRVLMIVSVDI